MRGISGVQSVESHAEGEASQVPIACNLPSGERDARADQVGDLIIQAQQIRELDDGYAFAFPASEEWAGRLLSFISIERECCPFFTFEMVFEADHGPLWLRF